MTMAPRNIPKLKWTKDEEIRLLSFILNNSDIALDYQLLERQMGNCSARAIRHRIGSIKLLTKASTQTATTTTAATATTAEGTAAIPTTTTTQVTTPLVQIPTAQMTAATQPPIKREPAGNGNGDLGAGAHRPTKRIKREPSSEEDL